MPKEKRSHSYLEEPDITEIKESQSYSGTNVIVANWKSNRHSLF